MKFVGYAIVLNKIRNPKETFSNASLPTDISYIGYAVYDKKYGYTLIKYVEDRILKEYSILGYCEVYKDKDRLIFSNLKEGEVYEYL